MLASLAWNTASFFFLRSRFIFLRVNAMRFRNFFRRCLFIFFLRIFMISRASFGALVGECEGSEISECMVWQAGLMMEEMRAGAWGSSNNTAKGLSSRITRSGIVESFWEGQMYWRWSALGQDARCRFSPPDTHLDRSPPPMHRLRRANFVLTASRLFVSLTPVPVQSLEFPSSLLHLARTAGWGGGGPAELLCGHGGSICCCRLAAGPAEDSLCLTVPEASKERRLKLWVCQNKSSWEHNPPPLMLMLFSPQIHMTHIQAFTHTEWQTACYEHTHTHIL